ncbi:hypothetical protein PV10_01942 [Exophiala mesophila]|uniref:Transcription factor domain-containing protein n=1 Tax=Exophiala mesophila TaxID=212818 RepID=A0A0D1X8E8_EXOME|nr:uncharacterized protein PV10_01942 [Exophiala mesophila]KIV98275.1 hypothetical protein PV10_01942 [Exophiala mesophila]
MAENSQNEARADGVSWYETELRDLQSANQEIAFYVNKYHTPAGNGASTSSDPNPQTDVPRLSFALPQHIYTSLDPFVALPPNVTEYERLRIQVYSQYLGGGLFGVKDTPRYSPTAATGIPTSIYSDVGREWICILVDHTLNAFRDGAQSKELVRQRARGYQHLNEAIRRRNENFQGALMALTICGLTEYRFGTTHSRNMHATAVERFLKSQPSLREVLAAAPNVEPIYISGQFGFGRCYFQNFEKLEKVKMQWKADLLSILNSPWPTLHYQASSSSTDIVYRQYLTKALRLGRIVVASTKTISPPTVFAASMQLNLLTETAWTLRQFGDLWHAALKFINRVEFISEGSLIGGVFGDKSFDLRGAALATMVSRARRDVLANFYPDQLADSDFLVTNMHMHALQMFQYLDPDGRALLLSKFSQWLLSIDKPTFTPLMSDAQISSLEAQINATWFQDHVSP